MAYHKNSDLKIQRERFTWITGLMLTSKETEVVEKAKSELKRVDTSDWFELLQTSDLLEIFCISEGCDRVCYSVELKQEQIKSNEEMWAREEELYAYHWKRHQA